MAGPVATPELTQPGPLGIGAAGLDPGLDIRGLQPVDQTDSLIRILRDLSQRDTAFAASGDRDHVIAELSRIRLGHDATSFQQHLTAPQIRCHLSVQQPRM